MADRSSVGRPAAGGPQRRKRWVIAGVALAWLLLMAMSGSVVTGSALLLALIVLAGLLVMILRGLGFGPGHPLVRPLVARPWRDGRDVLDLALRHLPEVFMVMPNGSLLAPSAVELCMNPADVDSLAEVIDLSLVNANAAEAYEAEVAACSAQVAHDLPVEVSVVADPAVRAGRYRLRQRRQPAGQPGPASPSWPAGQPAPAVASRAAGQPQPASPSWPARQPGLAFPSRPAGQPRPAGQSRAATPSQPPADVAGAPTLVVGEATVCEALGNPLLRLVTGESVAETRLSGARAGRGQEAELLLPDDLTISRTHARFTCAAGEWRVTGLGRNGVVLNGTPLNDEQALHDGDRIRWGRRPDAPVSWVEIR